MSYHVAIVRTKNGARAPVSRAEVDALLASRPDLGSRPTEGGGLEILGGDTLLWFQHGEIWTRNPDDATLRLLLELAAPLGARVRGDELETYRTVDETYVHPDDREEARAARQESADVLRNTRARQRRLNAILIGIFLLICLIAQWASRR